MFKYILFIVLMLLSIIVPAFGQSVSGWEAYNAPGYRPDSLSVQSLTNELETQRVQQQFEKQRREMENIQRQAEEAQREAERQQLQQQQLNELRSINRSLGGY